MTSSDEVQLEEAKQRALAWASAALGRTQASARSSQEQKHTENGDVEAKAARSADFDKLEADVKALREENNSLSRCLKSENEEKDQQIGRLTRRSEEVTRQAQAAERKVQQLQNREQELKDSFTELGERLLREEAQRDGKINNLESEAAAQSELMSEELADLQSRMSRLQLENSELANRNKPIVDLRDHFGQHRDRVYRLENQVSELEEWLAEKDSHLEVALEQGNSLISIASKLDELQSELAESILREKALQAQLSSAEVLSSTRLAELTDIESNYQKSQAIHKELGLVDKVTDQLQVQLRASGNMASDIESVVNQLQAWVVAQDEEERTKPLAEVEELQRRLAAAEKAERKAERTECEVKKRLEEGAEESQWKRTEPEIAALNTQLEELRIKLREREQEVEASKAGSADLMATKQQKEAVSREVAEECSTLRSQLTQSEKRASNLESMLLEARVFLEAKERRMKLLSRRHDAQVNAESANGKLKQQLENSMKRAGDLQELVTELGAQLDRREREVRLLTRRVQTAEKQGQNGTEGPKLQRNLEANGDMVAAGELGSKEDSNSASQARRLADVLSAHGEPNLKEAPSTPVQRRQGGHEGSPAWDSWIRGARHLELEASSDDGSSYRSERWQDYGWKGNGRSGGWSHSRGSW